MARGRQGHVICRNQGAGFTVLMTILGNVLGRAGKFLPRGDLLTVVNIVLSRRILGLVNIGEVNVCREFSNGLSLNPLRQFRGWINWFMQFRD